MKKGGKMYAKGGPAKRAQKKASLKKISKAVGPQKTKDKMQKKMTMKEASIRSNQPTFTNLKVKKMKKGGKMMAKGMRKGGKMMAKGMRKGGKMMSKGKRMNGKKNMGLFGRK